MKEKEIALRAKRAHERMHGQSIFIETRVMPSLRQVRVSDHELGIVTYWDIRVGKYRVVSFDKQFGERS